MTDTEKAKKKTVIKEYWEEMYLQTVHLIQYDFAMCI